MTEKPWWLPPKLDLTGKVEKECLSILYGIFEKDFKNTALLFCGLPVWWNRKVLPGQCYEEGFWHLVSREERDTTSRQLDVPRAEMLPWCRPSITYSNESSIKVWDYLEHGRRLRTYLWLKHWDYCVILERRNQQQGQIAWLITAFHVDGASRKRNLQRKFESRES